MDRTCFAILFLGLALLPTGRGSAADKAVDKSLPYSFIAIQVVPEDVINAVEYCKSHGIPATGMLGQVVESLTEDDEFSEFDLTQPARFETCIAPDSGSACQLMAFAGTTETILKMTGEDLSPVPGYSGLFQILDDEGENVESAFVRFENDRCYLAAAEGPMTSDIADKLLTRLKRDDKHNLRYQWSISSRPCEINPPMRKLMLKQLTRATSVQLQQRDDEDDLSYQLRSFWGKTRLAMLNTFAADCEYVEVGFTVDPAEERGTMEFTIKARENSTLDRWMTKTGKARSPFAGMMTDENQTGFALSFEMGETQKESLKSLTAATKDYLVEYHKLPVDEAAAFSKMVDEQIKRGAAHAYLQLEELNPLAPFASVSGGISLKNGETIVPVLNHVMTLIAKDVPGVLIGHAENDQPAIHFWNDPFGTSTKSTMAITANSNGIWFAFGEEAGTREEHNVAVPASDGSVRTVVGSHLVNVRSPDARERLVNLIADVQQSRQSRARGVLLQSFVSKQVWSIITLGSQFDLNESETRVETYTVQVPNADGTVRSEQRTRTVATTTRGGFKNTTSAGVTTADKDLDDSKIQQVAGSTATKNPKTQKAHGQIRLTTEPIKNGLRIHGDFEKSAIAGLLMVPEFLGAAYEVVGLE